MPVHLRVSLHPHGISHGHLGHRRVSESSRTSQDHYCANSQIDQATVQFPGQPLFLCGKLPWGENLSNREGLRLCVQDVGEIHCKVVFAADSGAAIVWDGVDGSACKRAGWCRLQSVNITNVLALSFWTRGLCVVTMLVQATTKSSQAWGREVQGSADLA